MWGSLGQLLVAIFKPLMRTAAAEWILRALFGAGLSFVAYKFAVQPLLDHLYSLAGEGGQDLIQWGGLLNFDKALTIIGSAYIVRFSVNALTLTKKA